MAAGVNRSKPLLRSASAIICPFVTATPLSVRLPAAGRALIFTPERALAGESLGSVNPKSAAAKAQVVSSGIVTVLDVPEGASFTGVTLMVNVLGLGSRLTPPLVVPPLSCTWKVKLV